MFNFSSFSIFMLSDLFLTADSLKNIILLILSFMIIFICKNSDFLVNSKYFK